MQNEPLCLNISFISAKTNNKLPITDNQNAAISRKNASRNAG
jgi:hypothetical protein